MAKMQKVKDGNTMLEGKKRLRRGITFMNVIKVIEVIALVYIAYKLSGL